jgi:LacI family transcriptional regulator
MQGAEMSNATISDVARKVGVSESTVSRYLSGFKVRNSESIKRAIKDLNYRPNIMARNLKSGKTGMVAVIVPDITNPFFASIVRGAEVAAGDEYMLQLISTGDDPEKEEAAIRRLIGRVDGLIYVPSKENSHAISEISKSAFPVVFVDRVISNLKSFDSVLADNYAGAFLATNHLIDHGHIEIAHIAGPVTSTPGKGRSEGYLAALKKSKITHNPNYFVESDFTVLGGYQAMMGLLSLKKRPSAVFAGNNLMTIGALKALKESKVSVPNDMAVIGFDDHELSDLVDPPLTVISRDAHLQGALAMSTLLERIREGYQFPPKQLKVDANLVIRMSCGSTCPHRKSNTSESILSSSKSS